MKKNITISLCATVLLATHLHAEQTLKLDSITVSASPIHNHDSFDVPAAVDVVDSKTLESKTTASLGAALSDVAGVNNISTGSQAGKPVLRGMTGERVKILSNGKTTDFQTYGIRHIANTDLFMAEHVEVIRGAQGVLYGSDALGGVVDVISPKMLSAKDGETKLKGEFLGEYHTNNNEKAAGVKMQSAYGKLGANVSVIKRKAENIQTPDADTWDMSQGMQPGDKPRFAGELPYTNFESTAAQVALGYTEDLWDIKLQHTYWQSYQNYLGHTGGPQFSPIPSAGQDLLNNETQLSANLYLGEWVLIPTVSRTLNSREAASGVAYEQMSDADIDLDILVDRVDSKVALKHPVLGDFEGEIGIEHYTKRQDVRAGHLVPNADEDGGALYIFEEADFGKWIAQAGLRYDTRSIRAENNTSKNFSAFGGSVGVTYKITERWNVATNISRGFRAPSVFELYADGIHGGVQAYQVGNPNLIEETTLGADLSLRYKSETTQASLTLYHTHIENYIYLANTGRYRDKITGAVVPEGTPGALPELTNEQTTAQMQGIELALESYVTDSTRVTGALEVIEGKDLDNDVGLTMMPANNLKLAVFQNIGSLETLKANIISLNMQAYAAKNAASSKEPFYQYNSLPFGSVDTDAYTLWGVGYESKFAFIAEDATFRINVDNVFDTEYRNFLDTYKGYALGMGRNISFSLSVPFSL